MTKQKADGEVFILLDASSSMMGSKWQEYLDAIGTYIANLGDKTAVNAFKFSNNLDIISKTDVRHFAASMSILPGNRMPKKEGVSPLEPLIVNGNNKSELPDTSPSGMTALNDALGYLIKDYVLKSDAPRQVVMVITDGQENASSQYSHQVVKDMLSELDKQPEKYDIIWLGADFKDVDAQATSYGRAGPKVMDLGGQNVRSAMASYAIGTQSYMDTGVGLDVTKLDTKV